MKSNQIKQAKRRAYIHVFGSEKSVSSRSRQGTQRRLNVSHGELSVWTKDHQKHTRMKCSNRFMSMAYRLSQSNVFFKFLYVLIDNL